MTMKYPNAFSNIKSGSIDKIVDAVERNPELITEETPLYLSFHPTSGHIAAVFGKEYHDFLCNVCGYLGLGKIVEPRINYWTIMNAIISVVTCAELDNFAQKLKDGTWEEYDETVELNPEIDPCENCDVEIIDGYDDETYECSEEVKDYPDGIEEIFRCQGHASNPTAAEA